MKYAANLSLLYTDRPLLERPAAAAADGFTGVEILFPYDVDATSLRAAIDEAGLQTVLINTPLGPAGERGFAAVAGAEEIFRRDVERALHTAAALGSPRLHTMAGDARLTGAAPTDTVRPVGTAASVHVDPSVLRTLVANLRWAASRAEQAGITLTLEALNTLDMPGYCYARPAQALAVLAEVDRPNVRLQFDFFHTAREGLVVLDELRRAWPMVEHCQIAGPPDRHEPGEADGELFAGVGWLHEHGYDGWLGFEYRPAGDTTAGLSWRRHLPDGGW